MKRRIVGGAVWLALCLLAAQGFGQDFDPANPFVGSGTLEMRGTPTDYITGGLQWRAAPENGQWTAQLRDDDDDGRPDYVDIFFLADNLQNPPAGVGAFWTLSFGVNQIPGAALEVGSYTDAQRASFADEGHPGLDIGGDGRGCNTISGDFDITAFEYDCFVSASSPTLHLRRFAATFEQHCDAGDAFLTGSIDYSAPATGLACEGGGDGDGDGGDDPPPPPPPFQVAFADAVWTTPVALANGGTAVVPFTTFVDQTFNSDLHLSVISNASPHEEFNVSIDPAFLAAPGSGTGNITVTAGPMTFPRLYTVTVFASDGATLQGSSFQVDVVCTPPSILGIDQPRFGTAGSNREIEVKASGSGPFVYQWYRGFRGMTRDPVTTTGPRLTVPNDGSSYWVRVRNACGTFDSEVATPR
jgi:hypothetical protein